MHRQYMTHSFICLFAIFFAKTMMENLLPCKHLSSQIARLSHSNCRLYKTFLSILKVRGYLPELFRQIRTYLQELFQQIKTYLPEPVLANKNLFAGTPTVGSLNIFHPLFLYAEGGGGRYMLLIL